MREGKAEHEPLTGYLRNKEIKMVKNGSEQRENNKRGGENKINVAHLSN